MQSSMQSFSNANLEVYRLTLVLVHAHVSIFYIYVYGSNPTSVFTRLHSALARIENTGILDTPHSLLMLMPLSAHALP
jgi:hypothetical protein